MSELTPKALAMLAAAPRPDDRRAQRDTGGRYTQFKPAKRFPLPTPAPAPPSGAGGGLIPTESAPATGPILTMGASAKYAFDRYGIPDTKTRIAIQKGEVVGAKQKLTGIGWDVPAEALDSWCKANLVPQAEPVAQPTPPTEEV